MKHTSIKPTRSTPAPHDLVARPPRQLAIHDLTKVQGGLSGGLSRENFTINQG